MSNEVMVLTKDELEANPSVIGENLAQLALAIKQNKDDLTSIKNRGFWKKLTNNNTRDLAEAMLKQNDTISAFLTITQGIIFLSMNNVVVLGGIMDALNKHENTNNIRDNKYIGMAKDYLSEAIKSAKRATKNEKQIENLKHDLNTYYKRQDKQGRFIQNLKEELILNKQSDEQQDKIIKDLINKLDNSLSLNKHQEKILNSLQKEIHTLKIENKRQSELINELEVDLLEKSKIDDEHIELINILNENANNTQQQLEVQDEEDKRQAVIIEKLVQELEKFKEEGNKSNSNMNNIITKVKKQIIYAYAFGGIGILMALVAILIQHFNF